MNSPPLQLALWFSALGAAVTGGVFFAFSTFVMAALGGLPPAQGLAAMQSINRSVLSSLFLAAFLLTTVTALAVAAASIAQRGPGALPAFASAALYVVGAFAVTTAVNVPLNDAIAALDPTLPDSAKDWANYLSTWTAWNHVRTAASLVALAGFILALQATARMEVKP